MIKFLRLNTGTIIEKKGLSKQGASPVQFVSISNTVYSSDPALKLEVVLASLLSPKTAAFDFGDDLGWMTYYAHWAVCWMAGTWTLGQFDLASDSRLLQGGRSKRQKTYPGLTNSNNRCIRLRSTIIRLLAPLEQDDRTMVGSD